MERLGYKIVQKTAHIIATRQAVQDRYSSIAQLSQVAALLAILRYGQDMRKARIMASAWTAWLGFLCVAETAPGKK